MRFELRLINDRVAINDTFNNRKLLFVPNNDASIRNGLKTFYNLDAFDLDMDENQQKQYVSCKMDELPKEDLSFKEVKGIE